MASASSTVETLTLPASTLPSSPSSSAFPPRAKSTRLSSTFSALNSLHSAQDEQPKSNGATATNAVPHNHRPHYIIGKLPPPPLVPSPHHHMPSHYLRAFSALQKGGAANVNANSNNGGPPPLHSTSASDYQHQSPPQHHQNHQPQFSPPLPQSSIYSHIQSGNSNSLGSGRLTGTAHATGGYILSVNTATGETLTSSGFKNCSFPYRSIYFWISILLLIGSSRVSVQVPLPSLCNICPSRSPRPVASSICS